MRSEPCIVPLPLPLLPVRLVYTILLLFAAGVFVFILVVRSNTYSPRVHDLVGGRKYRSHPNPLGCWIHKRAAEIARYFPPPHEPCSLSKTGTCHHLLNWSDANQSAVVQRPIDDLRRARTGSNRAGSRWHPHFNGSMTAATRKAIKRSPKAQFEPR